MKIDYGDDKDGRPEQKLNPGHGFDSIYSIFYDLKTYINHSLNHWIKPNIYC